MSGKGKKLDVCPPTILSLPLPQYYELLMFCLSEYCDWCGGRHKLRDILIGVCFPGSIVVLRCAMVVGVCPVGMWLQSAAVVLQSLKTSRESPWASFNGNSWDIVSDCDRHRCHRQAVISSSGDFKAAVLTSGSRYLAPSLCSPRRSSSSAGPSSNYTKLPLRVTNAGDYP
jgi:hypothetical protein